MAASSKPKVKRYYIRNEIVPFEEDMYHEFKGHRNLAVEELPPWTQENNKSSDRASRRAVSRTLNAFVNTGKGGTVYLGIVDSGSIRGLKLTQYQKDHVIGSLDDLFGRYNPPVKPHRYKVKFVPVLEKQSSEEDIRRQCSFDSSEQLEDSDRLRPHNFRSYSYCWCDKDAIAQYNCGVMSPDYIIEISVKAWDRHDPRNQEDACGSLLCLHPLHEDEEGTVYFRRQASLIKYSMTEIAQLTRQEVQDGCEAEIARLKKEVSMWKNAAAMGVNPIFPDPDPT